MLSRLIQDMGQTRTVSAVVGGDCLLQPPNLFSQFIQSIRQVFVRRLYCALKALDFVV
jgi:hypothetical protein